jgi:microcystin-dependent protein
MATPYYPIQPPGQQFFTNAGVVAAGYFLYVFEAGSTTPATVYQGATGTPHAHPIVLDSAGRVPNGTGPFIDAGRGYKFALKTPAGVQLWEQDNVSIPDPALGATAPEAVGSVKAWFTAVPPEGWLILNAQAVSRATYAALFTLWGTTFGVGDGVTTFNVPDMRGRFPLGVAAAGTGSTLGGVGGNIIDYIHVHPQTVHAHNAGTFAVADHLHEAGTLVTGVESNSDDFTIGAVPAAAQGHTHDVSGNTANGGAQTVTGASANSAAVDTGNSAAYTPPFRALHFIVKALETTDNTIIGSVQTYVPVWTAVTVNPTLGNGTLTGRYIQIGKLVRFNVVLTIGGTTTLGTGAWIFTLPIASADVLLARAIVSGVAQTVAGASKVCGGRASTTTTFRGVHAATDLYLDAAVPIAWAAGDILTLSGSYEAA